MPDLPESADDPRKERLCEHPLVTHFLGIPLHVLAQGSCGRKGDRIVRHVWNGERPFGSVRQTEFGLVPTLYPADPGLLGLKRASNHVHV